MDARIAANSLTVSPSSDQRLATGRQARAFKWALLWSFQPGNPIGTVNRTTTPKPRIGNPEPRLGVPSQSWRPQA